MSQRLTKKQKEQEREEAIKYLRKMIRPGTEVYTLIRHVSRSGMSRDISCFIVKAHSICTIDWHVQRVLDYPFSKNQGIKVGGCGMDMGYHVVNSLSYALHGMKDRGDGAREENQGRPYPPRPGHFRAGYSLEHRHL